MTVEKTVIKNNMLYYETNLVVHKEKLIGGIPNNKKSVKHKQA